MTKITAAMQAEFIALSSADAHDTKRFCPGNELAKLSRVRVLAIARAAWHQFRCAQMPDVQRLSYSMSTPALVAWIENLSDRPGYAAFMRDSL